MPDPTAAAPDPPDPPDPTAQPTIDSPLHPYLGDEPAYRQAGLGMLERFGGATPRTG